MSNSVRHGGEHHELRRLERNGSASHCSLMKDEGETRGERGDGQGQGQGQRTADFKLPLVRISRDETSVLTASSNTDASADGSFSSKRRFLRSRSLSHESRRLSYSAAMAARSRDQGVGGGGGAGGAGPTPGPSEVTSLLSPPPPPSPSPLDGGDNVSRDNQPQKSNKGDGLRPSLLPVITYDAASAPPSPTEARLGPWQRYGTMGGRHRGSVRSYEGRTVLVTQRGSFLAVGQTPHELRESCLSISSTYPDIFQLTMDDSEEVFLMYARHEKIPMKDFAAEIRASVDVENFLQGAQLMLDMQESNMEDIVEAMLHHLLKDEEPTVTVEDASRAVFTHDSIHQLSKTIQGTCTFGGSFDYDQTWICILCTLPTIQKRHVAIARLKNPANLGRTCQEVYFVILVVAPTKQKGTKNALETGRTFSTLFADMDLRLGLLAARTDDEFKQLLWHHMKALATEQSRHRRKLSTESGTGESNTFTLPEEKSTNCWLGKELISDFKRRLKCYSQDYKDGVVGHRTLQKTASTTIFLYFACILPSIALGVLNDTNTIGYLNVKKAIYSQALGGMVFSLLGGQPMVILLTTAPLALYTKAMYNVCEVWGVDFPAMYAATGIWNSFFLLLYALTNASNIMKWSTRSTDEIVALFISITFIVDAIKDVYKDFAKYYYSKACDVQVAPPGGVNVTAPTVVIVATTGNWSAVVDGVLVANSSRTGGGVMEACQREHSLLFLFLMLATVWLGLSLYNFTKTPYLNAGKRELLADYALPVSVIVMSFCGSFLFRQVRLEPFNYDDSPVFAQPQLYKLPWMAVLGSMGMGFFLSLLFFFDQNIAAAIVNSPENRLKKGPAYHWDLFVVGLLNGALTFHGLPMVHGTLPHSPLHVHAMADVEDRVDQGHVRQKIIHVRETRLTSCFSHILIGLSILLLPYPLAYIPRPVLDGIFLYLVATAVQNNQMFERVLLLVTEQSAYPPNHYIRGVPQRKVHLFTVLQLLQLAAMAAVGFAPLPYLKMGFPVIILALLPFRHRIVPLMIEKKYLESLDGH